MSALRKEDEDYSAGWGVYSMYNDPKELEDRHNEVLLPAMEEKEDGGAAAAGGRKAGPRAVR